MRRGPVVGRQSHKLEALVQFQAAQHEFFSIKKDSTRQRSSMARAIAS